MSFFGFKAILGHEGGTQKFRAVAQNKAIQIRFQMIKKKISSDKFKKFYHRLFTFSYDPIGNSPR